jgi:DNA-binding CsgD family transcriptional regulator
MDLSEQSFHRFIDLIYQAVEDPRHWRALYEQLRQAIGAGSIHMLGIDKQHGTLAYSDGANLDTSGELAYMQQYRHIDPRVPIILASEVGRWTHCHEVLDEAFVASDPYYQEFLLPHDRRYMSATKVVDAPQAVVIFSTLCAPTQGPLPPESVAFLDRLMPHLQRACRIGLRNFVYSTQALVGHMLVDKLRQPVLLVTTGGEVMHTNEAAQALLRATRLVRVESNRLALPPADMEAMLRAFRRMEQQQRHAQLASGPDATAPAAQASHFRSQRIEGPAAGGLPESLYAFYSLLSPAGTMGAFGLRPVVMLMFYHPSSGPSIDAGLLYAVFGLTPAESRIATLLAEGLSLKEIASAQGTQHETVRKQLRSIYQKTATNRQPELVRLLLHLPHTAVRG